MRVDYIVQTVCICKQRAEFVSSSWLCFSVQVFMLEKDSNMSHSTLA